MWTTGQYKKVPRTSLLRIGSCRTVITATSSRTGDTGTRNGRSCLCGVESSRIRLSHLLREVIVCLNCELHTFKNKRRRPRLGVQHRTFVLWYLVKCCMCVPTTAPKPLHPTRVPFFHASCVRIASPKTSTWYHPSVRLSPNLNSFQCYYRFQMFNGSLSGVFVLRILWLLPLLLLLLQRPTCPCC